MVFNSLAETKDYDFKKDVPYLVRTDKNSLFGGRTDWEQILNVATRLNIVITDIETFTEDDFTTYKWFLQNLSGNIKQLYIKGKTPQLNLLTDRMMLDEMNNCGAGDTTVTLAPDGNSTFVQRSTLVAMVMPSVMLRKDLKLKTSNFFNSIMLHYVANVMLINADDVFG